MRSLISRLRTSLLARVLAFCVLLVLITGIVVAGVFLFALRDVFMAQSALRATSLARAVAARAQFALLVGDRDQLRQLASDAVAHEDALFVVINGVDGTVIRETQPDFSNDRVPSEALWDQASPQSVRGRIGVWGAWDLVEAQQTIEPPAAAMQKERGTPVQLAKPIGSLRVGISLHHARNAVLDVIWKSVGIAFLCVLVILFLEARRLNRILAPLRTLADVTGRIGENNLSERVPVEGGDEIAELGNAFNGMLERLAATLVSKEIAEDANLAKSRFLANAGHELRTPLNAVIGYSEMLEEDCRERGLHDLIPDLQRIHNSGRMLLELMNDLLDYSKSESGKMQMNLRPVAVSSVIEEVVGTVEPMALKNGNQIVVEPAVSDLQIMADRGRFRQSLLNLASNACKFTEQGTITLSATLNGDQCEISVRDTGTGISQEDLGKLFEAFVQVDNSERRKHGGTGLGLAISRKFCRMMGGDIQVESKLGSGSRFTILLPLAQAPDRQSTIPAAVES